MYTYQGVKHGTVPAHVSNGHPGRRQKSLQTFNRTQIRDSRMQNGPIVVVSHRRIGAEIEKRAKGCVYVGGREERHALRPPTARERAGFLHSAHDRCFVSSSSSDSAKASSRTCSVVCFSRPPSSSSKRCLGFAPLSTRATIRFAWPSAKFRSSFRRDVCGSAPLVRAVGFVKVVDGLSGASSTSEVSSDVDEAFERLPSSIASSLAIARAPAEV